VPGPRRRHRPSASGLASENLRPARISRSRSAFSSAGLAPVVTHRPLWLTLGIDCSGEALANLLIGAPSIESPDLQFGRRCFTEDLVLDRDRGEAPLASRSLTQAERMPSSPNQPASRSSVISSSPQALPRRRTRDGATLVGQSNAVAISDLRILQIRISDYVERMPPSCVSVPRVDSRHPVYGGFWHRLSLPCCYHTDV
jgi:hypothetical protein